MYTERGRARINPRHIVELESMVEHGTTALLDSGQKVTLTDVLKGVEQSMTPVVPAYPGFFVITAILGDVGEPVTFQTAEVVGWRDSYGCQLPVAYDGSENGDDGPKAIVTPSGAAFEWETGARTASVGAWQVMQQRKNSGARADAELATTDGRQP